MNRRLPLAILVVLLAGLGVGVAWNIWLSVDVETRDISELPQGVFYVPPDQYQSTTLTVAPGAVLLPELDSKETPLDRGSSPAADASGYAPHESCRDCHQERYDHFLLTAHSKTSGLCKASSVHGPFTGDRNSLQSRSPKLSFRMDARDDGFYQTVRIDFGQRRYTRSWHMDVVTGSGKMGQSFLFWEGDSLFQLPVSYFRELDQWINSPGYLDGIADFARPIIPRCLECHATTAQHVPGSVNRYVVSSVMWGVTCQRCHGPAAAHVAHHREHPGSAEARYIVNPGRLPRDRQIELCAQCHSGIGESLKPAFTYRPGERLDEYLRVSRQGEQVEGGVHTDNQYARLAMSRCFQQSETLTCATCHDPHEHQRGQHDLFSRVCLSCHQPEHCRLAADAGPALRENCIDCHMPNRRDTHTRMQTEGTVVFPLLRDHWIKPWPEPTARFLTRRQKLE